MNKNKIIMCSIGGVALVASLVLGYLVWSAWEEKTEKEDDLETAKANVRRINSSKISPEQASLDAFEKNRRDLAIWRDEAIALSSRGDRSPRRDITPEAFKRLLVDEAREEARRPGGVDGKIVKDGFEFGFKDFISGGRMPESSQLDTLQRQWDDVKFFTDILSAAGVSELQEITIAEKKVEAAAQPQQRGHKRGAKKEPEKKAVAETQGYELKFTARPLAFVKTINAFAHAERFVSVDSFSCKREDALAAALDEKSSSSDAPATSSRRRRSRRAAEEAENAQQNEESASTNKKGLVIDPGSQAPFIVTMKLTVYDFGTALVDADAEQKEVQE